MQITEGVRQEIARLTSTPDAMSTAYDSDPRVTYDGAGGFTVTGSDSTYSVRDEGSFGWCIYYTDGRPLRAATGDPITGIRYPGKAIGAIIGDPITQ